MSLFFSKDFLKKIYRDAFTFRTYQLLAAQKNSTLYGENVELEHVKEIFSKKLNLLEPVKTLLDEIMNIPVPGINKSMVYFSGAQTTSSLHLEDFGLPSMNFLFPGSSCKVNY